MTEAVRTRSGSAAAWLLYVLQLLGSGLLGLLAITSVFMTDSCGSVADEPAVCDTGYLGSVLIGYWIALALLLVLVPIAIVRSSRRGQASWLRALGGLVLAGVLTVAFVLLVLR